MVLIVRAGIVGSEASAVSDGAIRLDPAKT